TRCRTRARRHGWPERRTATRRRTARRTSSSPATPTPTAPARTTSAAPGSASTASPSPPTGPPASPSPAAGADAGTATGGRRCSGRTGWRTGSPAPGPTPRRAVTPDARRHCLRVADRRRHRRRRVHPGRPAHPLPRPPPPLPRPRPRGGRAGRAVAGRPHPPDPDGRPSMTTHSSKPPLSFETRGDQLAGVLRVDQIRTDTLVQLVQRWADPQARDEVIAALDELADVVTRPAREGELDAAVEQVEDTAGMDTAQVDVLIPDVRRLLGELTVVARRLGRFAVRRVPGQRGAA